MELAVIFFVIVCIVWIVSRMRAKTRAKIRATKTAALERAWRAVLSDPNYKHRRRYEERKREDEAQARKDEGL